MRLTSSQSRAVQHAGRNLQLIACAGSGKTEVVARRVVHLLAPGRADSLAPRNIIAFTFTDKAAAELKERIVTRTRQALGELPGMAEMFVDTIRAYCLELLESEAPKYLEYEVLSEVQQGLFVDRNSKRSGLTASTDLAGATLERDLDTQRYITALSILREAAVEVLTTDDGLRSRLADRVRHVIVDEYQDVNPVQEAVVWCLHELGAHICVVGEDDQTIYQWRGSVKSALEKRGRVLVELIMIRPDTLAEGLKATQPEMLFSPLALPDIKGELSAQGKGEKEVRVTLEDVALFDRRRRSTEYKAAASGYVSAWYLDEDYDGDCFGDCQMFFDFKKTPNIKAASRAEVDPEEFTLELQSEAFPLRGYQRIAVKVVDVYGNESTVVRELGA